MATAVLTYNAPPEVENHIESGKIMNATWGHLQPVPRTRYYGLMMFTFVNREWNFLYHDFPELGDPWSHGDMTEFFNDEFSLDREEGLYLWEGYYICFKNGNHRFNGKYKRTTIEAVINICK